MNGFFLLTVLSLILIMLVVVTWWLRNFEKETAELEEGETTTLISKRENVVTIQTFVYTAIVLTSVCLVVSVYLIFRGTIWEGHLMEWMNIVVRLMHITF